MDLKPLAVASWFLFVLSAVGCDHPLQEPLSNPEVPPGPNLLAAEIRRSETEPRVEESLSQLLEQAGSVPGVEAVAITDILPGVAWRREDLRAIRRDGSQNPTAAHVRVISPAYFETMEIRLLEGRLFSERDDPNGTAVAIVSETYAKKNWPEGSPLGKRLNLDNGPVWFTIVAVVEDGPKAEGLSVVYLPFTQSGFQARPRPARYVLARIAGDPKAAEAALQKATGQEFRSLQAWAESRAGANR